MEKTCGGARDARFPPDFILTDREYAAFTLSGASLFATHDTEYAPCAAAFLRLYGNGKPIRQTDPAEVEAAMRLTVRGTDDEKSAARHRHRLLMNAVFERCGFDPAIAG